MTVKARILVMDDEELIQDVLSNMLDFLGYEVEIASNGIQALDMYKKAKEAGKKFDAVIMDLSIPGGMGGKEAINDLLKIDPDAKALVSSGYSMDPVMSMYKDYGFKGVVTKPFKMEDLSKTLQSIIKS